MHEFSFNGDVFENPADDARSLESCGLLNRAPPSSSPRQMALTRIIESEIIPRLMLSNRVQRRSEIQRRAIHPDVSDFVKLLLGSDRSAALAYVQQLENQGVPLDVIYLDFLGGASRYLGTLWDADHCDFIEVTDGLHRLQNILKVLSQDTKENPVEGRRAMFMTAPSETHDFGIAIVEKFFRDSGWRTKRCFEQDHAAALREVHYDVVGFSLSCDIYIDGLNAAVKKARQVSRNPSIKVLVGGMAFQRHPELIQAVDADGMAADAQDAVRLAENLLIEGAFV